MDYLAINNYNRLGSMGISRNAIRTIALNAVSHVKGAAVYSPFHKRKKAAKKKAIDLSEIFTLPNGVSVALHKDGRAEIKIEVEIKAGENASDVAKAIQKEVADSLELMCDVKSFDIKLHIARIVDEIRA